MSGVLVPDLKVEGTRALRLATEEEVRAALRDKNVDVIECAVISTTYVVSRSRLVLVRSGMMGGDVFDVHGGLLYPNDIALLLDAHEIRQVAAVPLGS